MGFTILGTLTLAKICLLLAMFFWLVKILLGREKIEFSNLTHQIIPVFIAFYFLVSLASGLNAASLGSFAFTMLRRLNLIIMLLFIVLSINRFEYFKKILFSLLIGVILVSYIGLYEAFTGNSILEIVWGPDVAEPLNYILGQQGFRIRGTSGDPDFHTILMNLGTILSLLFLLLTRSRLARIGLFVSFLVFGLNILATGSRGGTFSFVISIIVFALLAEFKYKRRIVGISSMISAIVFGFIAYLIPQLPTERLTLEAGRSSIRYRIGWIGMAFDMFLDHPFIGVGTGNFTVQYHNYLNPMTPRDVLWTHNSYMQVLSENGILGLLLYLLIFLTCFTYLLKGIRLAKKYELRMVSVSLLSIFAGYAFFAGTSNVLENEFYWMVFAFSMVVNGLVNRDLDEAAK